MDVDIYRVELRGREYIAVREKTAGKPIVRVFANTEYPPSSPGVLREIRKAISNSRSMKHAR